MPSFEQESADALGERWRRGVARRARVIYESAHGNPITDDARGMRWGIRPRLAAIAALIVIALGTVVVWSMRAPSGAAAGHPSEAGSQATFGSQSVGPSASSAPGEDNGSWATSTGNSEVVVHVAGQVARPGLLKLAAGSRVDDAIEAAGGFTTDAARDDLNLARILVDGEQVYVPGVGLGSEEASGGSSTGQISGGVGEDASRATGAGAAKINVNRADADELEELPGVGPVLAQRIEQYRDLNGPFIKLEDLEEVSGIGPSLLEQLVAVATV